MSIKTKSDRFGPRRLKDACRNFFVIVEQKKIFLQNNFSLLLQLSKVCISLKINLRIYRKVQTN